MAHRKTERNPLFAGRWFEDDIILLCLRWYFRFKLSYRDLVAILGERGLSISHTTILRWVIRYAETCEKRWGRFERQVGGSWRVDETFIKVRGQLMYLYRAVDGQGNTVEFFLSRTRGIAAAKAFFRKALKHHQEPHSITLDGHRQVIETLSEVMLWRGVPEHIRSDNEPEFIAKQLRQWLAKVGTRTLYIEPGSRGRTDFAKVLTGSYEMSA